VRLPEPLHRYHTCAKCGKARHRSRMIRWGDGYACQNEELCWERAGWQARMDAYLSQDPDAERERVLAARREALDRVRAQLREDAHVPRLIVGDGAYCAVCQRCLRRAGGIWRAWWSGSATCTGVPGG
jgi:hypothetical protein